MAVLARDRLEIALSRINDPSGEGERTFLTTYQHVARDAADASDRRSRAGTSLGPLDGTIVSIKDLFDVAGEPTRAGSLTLARGMPATRDAVVVHRLRQAGAVIVGKTNMSEFAFTGVGMNPHFGTPGNPADRSRVPGGSSSGAPVAVADGMCEISIGTDTGGSTRIPAALCGLVGYKPTKHRIPTNGAFPLSPTLDSVGPVAQTVSACAAADAVLAGEAPCPLGEVPLNGLRFAVAQGLPLGELDEHVARHFESALALLGQARVILSDVDFPQFGDMARVNSIATIGSVEAYRIHKERLATQGADIDPRVRERIAMGGAATDADYALILKDRRDLADAMDRRLGEFEAVVLPTTPIVAPIVDELSDPDRFRTANRLLLRNTAIANFFDLCAISVPMPEQSGLPTGLMLFGRRSHDRQLFRVAASIERLFVR